MKHLPDTFDDDDGEAVELRVLHGPQAGSRLSLMPGETYLVGSGDGCAIMLAGAQVQAEHASISVDSTHWYAAPAQGSAVRLDGQACDAAQPLDFGTVVQLGLVKLTIDHEDADWPQEVALEPQPRAEDPPPEPPPADDGPTEPAPAAVDMPAARERLPSPRRHHRAAALALLGSVACLAVAVTSYAGWQLSLPPTAIDTAAAMPADQAPPPAEPPSPAEQMQLWMAAQGGASTLQLDGGGSAPWRVVGHVPAESDRKRLLDATRTLTWPVEIAVLTGVERRARLARYLDEQSTSPGLALRLNTTDTSRAAVKVMAESRDRADAFVTRLRKDLSPLEPIELEVLLPPDIRQRFLDGLDRTGLAPRFDVVRTEPDLSLTALLKQGEVATWERYFGEFTADHGSVLKISALIRTERDAVESRILAVVSGAYPYVLTTSGERVAPGGQIDGKALVAVNAQEIVFADGLRVRLRP